MLHTSVTHVAASGTAGVDVCALGVIRQQPMLSFEYSRINLLGKISAGSFFFFFAREEHLNDSHPLFL